MKHSVTSWIKNE